MDRQNLHLLDGGSVDFDKLETLKQYNSSPGVHNGVYGRVEPACSAVISVTEVNLARVPRALEGEVKGGSSLEGAGKGRLWRKGSHKGVD